MIGGDAVIAECTHALSKRRIVGRNHPAFAGRDMFDRMETEGVQIGERTDLAPLVGSPYRMAGVVDQGKAMSVGDAAQCVVVARLAGIVNGNDCFSARSNSL